MSWNREPESQIFISYRRADALGFAGRLSDSLEAWFGENRVFRDVENIDGGEDYTDRIERTLSSADAVIVVIGPKWANLEDDTGRRRLDDPSDLLVREILVALEHDVPIFPVLLEGARMPTPEELPESLKPLARRNAITLTDDQWERDVTRLARIIAIDVPGSVVERKLFQLRAAFLSCMSFAMFITPCLFAWRTYAVSLPLIVDSTHVDTERKEWIVQGGGEDSSIPFAEALLSSSKAADDLDASALGAILDSRLDGESRFFPVRDAVVSFVLMVVASFLMTLAAPLMAPKRRPWAYGAAMVGLVGTLASLIVYILTSGPFDTVFAFAGSSVVCSAMLMLAMVCGFKPR